MPDIEIVDVLRKFLTENAPMATLMESLPDQAEIRLIMAGRFSGVIAYREGGVQFTDNPVSTPDFEVNISTEAIRRIVKENPSTLAHLLEEIVRESIAMNIKWKVKASPKELWERGYALTGKKLYPHIRGEVFQKVMIALGLANAVFETAKTTIKSKIKSVLK